MNVFSRGLAAQKLLSIPVCVSCAIVVILAGSCSTSSISQSQTGGTSGTIAVDVKTEAINHMGEMFAGGTKIWYQYAEKDDSANKNQTKTEFDLEEAYSKRYEHLSDCIWERSEAPSDITSASVSIGDDKEHCFRFLLGSDSVICIDGEKTTYYRAYIETPRDSLEYPKAPLSEDIKREYSGYEVSASNLPLKDDNFKSKEDIAYAFLAQKIAYLKCMTPENWYALTDYQILELRLEEDGGAKFIFSVKTAIKPKVYANEGLPWIAGNGENGEGKWSGYIINSGGYRLDLKNGYWEGVGPAGDITLNDPSA